MVKMIVGPKGSGKTKKLAEMIGESAKKCSGSVLCVKKGDCSVLRIPLSNNNIRIIDTNDFGIKSYDELYGLIAGAVASNYDIEEIFIDGTLKIGGDNFLWLNSVISKLRENILKDKVNLTMTISCSHNNFQEDLWDSGYINFDKI